MSSIEPQEGSYELNGGQKGGFKLIITGGNSPKSFDLIEESFDEVPLTIEGEIGLARHESIGLGRNDGCNVSLNKDLDQSVGIVGFVGQECARFNFVE